MTGCRVQVVHGTTCDADALWTVTVRDPRTGMLPVIPCCKGCMAAIHRAGGVVFTDGTRCQRIRTRHVGAVV